MIGFWKVNQHFLLKWKIMLITLANGIISKDTAGVNRFGAMVLFMKETFKMIWQMVEAD